jgi:hypothetical protein
MASLVRAVGVAAALGVAAPAVAAFVRGGGSESLSSSTAPWAQELEQRGFTVQEGEVGFFDLVTCANPLIDTCYAANALTPYGLLYLPPAPGERAEEAAYDYCRHGICRRRADNVTLSVAWRMQPGESILVVGQTPPKSTYWSMAPSLFSRFHDAGWHDSIPLDKKYVGRKLSACPRAGRAGDRCELFASVDDPLNHLTVRLREGAESPFSQPFSVLLSVDSVGDAAARSVLESAAAGLGGALPLNSLRFPGAVLRLGVRSGKEDDLSQVLRVEGVESEAERAKFYSSTPLRVYRISPPSELQVPRDALWPSREGAMRVRETGAPEQAPGLGHRALGAALAELRATVVGRLAAARLSVRSVAFDSFVQDSGYECIEQGTRCQGDCRDTIYAKATFLVHETLCNKTHAPCGASEASELSREDPDDAFVVVGVVHSATGSSLYSSISAYDWPKLAPVGTLPDKAMLGSAKAFLPEGHPAADYLYVVTFKRKCTAQDGQSCVELPAATTRKDVSPLAYGSPLIFIERCYVNPLTKSGPAVSETLLPTLLHVRSERAPRPDLDGSANERNEMLILAR